MSFPSLPKADPLPLREALRGLRFLLHRGRETVADTLALDDLPEPVSGLATAVLKEADGLARSFDSLASTAVRTVLGAPASPSDPLDQIINRDGAEAEFSRAIYVALSSVLRRHGADSAFVSEMSARAAFVAWRKDGLQAGQPQDWLADLTLRLRDARVIRGARAEKSAAAPQRDLEAVAIFAVLLWLQSARSDAENAEALESAAAIAQARADEIAATVRENSLDRIAALYLKYVDHV